MMLAYVLGIPKKDKFAVFVIKQRREKTRSDPMKRWDFQITASEAKFCLIN